MFVVRTGRGTFGPTWDASKLDNLTLGLDRHTRRNLHRLPGAIAALAGSARCSRPSRAVRRHADADPGDRDAPGRPPLAERRLRHDHGPSAGLGGLHAAAQRDRRTRDLAAAGDHRRGASAGDDAGRRSGSRGPAARAGLRAGGGRSVAPDPGLRRSGQCAEAISVPARPCVFFSVVAPLAQSAERLHGKEKVYGSIP